MNRKLWLFKPIVYVMVIFCTLVVFATFFVSKLLFWIEAALLLALYIYLLVSLSKVNKDINEYLQYMAKTLDSQMHGFLPNFPLPVVVSNDLDEIIWYNKPFESTVIHNKQMIGSSINILVPDVDLEGDILTKGIRLRYEDGNF